MFAQADTPEREVPSDMVSLNIVLSPIQSIVVNPTQKVVSFVYESANNYKEGVIHELADHLTITVPVGMIIILMNSLITKIQVALRLNFLQK